MGRRVDVATDILAVGLLGLSGQRRSEGVADVAFRVAFFTDTHLGYAARCRSDAATGFNQRVLDGYRGFRETVEGILEEHPDVVLHGGDLFHRSHPTISDITYARRQLSRFHSAGIPFIGVTGNHDFANERGRMPATAAVEDADRSIRMVVRPQETFHVAEGVTVHAVSHIGLAAAVRAIPEPVDGEVNIFVSHGAAQVPGHEIFACVDSPGEAVIGFDVLSMPWNVGLLGHYHGRGALPGFMNLPRGEVWYGGSLLRRGFSDPDGKRGWLLCTIQDDGDVVIEQRHVKQRPQFDFSTVDAAGLTASEVEERIRANIAAHEVGESIIRQRVINCSLPVRRGVDTAALAELTEAALVWQIEFIRPQQVDFAELTDEEASVASMRTSGSSDLPAMWRSWAPQFLERQGTSVDLRDSVIDQGSQLLEAVRKDGAADD